MSIFTEIFVMKRALYLFLFVLDTTFLPAQLVHPSFSLITGKEYALKVDVNQNTIAQSNGMDEDISLDIGAAYHFIVDSLDSDGNYMLSAFYTHLSISMVAPSMKISLNPESSSGKLLQEYLELLQNFRWKLVMTPAGELKEVSGLNEVFQLMSEREGSRVEQDIIIKTLNEAFGTEAVLSFSNMILHIYPDYNAPGRWEMNLKHNFNTREVDLRNKWYYTLNKSGQQLIQGMGVFNSAESDTLEYGGLLLTTSLSGNQTYDYQTNKESGWISSGNSRQRMIVLNKIVNDPSFPEGLEIPVYTETIYTIRDASPVENEEAKQAGRKRKK